MDSSLIPYLGFWKKSFWECGGAGVSEDKDAYHGQSKSESGLAVCPIAKLLKDFSV